MINRILAFAFVGAACATAAGCAATTTSYDPSMPPLPSIAVMPAKGKSYAAFQKDDAYCQAQAETAVGGQNPVNAEGQSTAAGAAVGTAVGAIAGAAIGSASGHAGAGAAIGAGTGLITGAAIGAGNGRSSGASIQSRFDVVYAQCMAAKGNQVVSQPAPGPITYVYDQPGPYYLYPRPFGYGYGYGYRRRWW